MEYKLINTVYDLKSNWFFLQTSPESPLIIDLLLKVFSGQPLSELKTKALETLSEDEYTVKCYRFC